MTRTIFAIAAGLFGWMAFFASSAEACISCEYVPEVVNTPSPHQPKAHKKKRAYDKAVEQRKVRPQKRKATAKTGTKKLDTAKTAPTKTEAEKREPATSTAALKSSDTVDEKKTASEDTGAAESVGCKKFSPTAGVTINVPCE